MNLVDLSPTLTIDVDKVIGIRASDDYNKMLLLFKGGDTMSISLEESYVLRRYSGSGDSRLSEALKDELGTYITEVLTKFFSKKGLAANYQTGAASETINTPTQNPDKSIQHWKEDLTDSLITYLREGHTVKETADHFGMSERTAYRYLKNRKII